MKRSVWMLVSLLAACGDNDAQDADVSDGDVSASDASSQDVVVRDTGTGDTIDDIVSSDAPATDAEVEDSGPGTRGLTTFSRICVEPLNEESRAFVGAQPGTLEGVPDTFAATHEVSSAAELIAAVESAAPGDLIAIADGTHAWGEVRLGTLADGRVQHGGSGFEPGERVWIMPATPGGATFRGTFFDLYAQHLTFNDLRFEDSRIKMWAAPGTRVTHCTFVGGSGPGVSIDASRGISVDDVEIDNNRFDGLANQAISWQTRPPAATIGDRWPTPQRMWVHHNSIVNQGGGGLPCIGAGVGWHPFAEDQPAHTLIEYNHLDGCTGDDEAVEIKHRGVWLRYNLLENSGPGHYSGRMTSNAHYTGNLHLGGGGNGFRVFGSDNTGVYNYMHSYRSFTVSASEPSDYPNIDYAYLAQTDGFYAKNVFFENAVWMNVQDRPGHVNEIVPSGNVLRDNFWLGGARDYADRTGATPYETWLETNPGGAHPGDNHVLEDAGEGCFATTMTSVELDPVVMEGEWTTEHRGESSPDVVHRLPFWWDQMLTFEP